MKPTELELKIQTEHIQAVCIGFEKFCKNNKLPVSRMLPSGNGKLSRQTLYAIIRGEKTYLPINVLAYLASKTNLSIGQLAIY